jgi:hypothetical protein
VAEGETPPVSKSREAKYANYFEIGFNEFELVMDFGQLYSPGTSPALHTRIITSPTYAATLLDLLRNVLAEHRRKFGTNETGDKTD